MRITKGVLFFWLIALGMISFNLAQAAEVSDLNQNAGYKSTWVDAHPVEARYNPNDGHVYVQMDYNPIGDACRFADRWDFRFDGRTSGGRAFYSSLQRDLWTDVIINFGFIKVDLPRGTCTTGRTDGVAQLVWNSSYATL